VYIGKLKMAVIIRCGGCRDAGCHIDKFDLTTCDWRSARVSDESKNGGCLKLRLDE
jgi:hypothetical protein